MCSTEPADPSLLAHARKLVGQESAGTKTELPETVRVRSAARAARSSLAYVLNPHLAHSEEKSSSSSRGVRVCGGRGGALLTPGPSSWPLRATRCPWHVPPSPTHQHLAVCSPSHPRASQENDKVSPMTAFLASDPNATAISNFPSYSHEPSTPTARVVSYLYLSGSERERQCGSWCDGPDCSLRPSITYFIFSFKMTTM